MKTIFVIFAGTLALSSMRAALPPELAAQEWVESDVEGLVVAYPAKWKVQHAGLVNAKFYVGTKPPDEAAELYVKVVETGVINTPAAKADFMDALIRSQKAKEGTTVHVCELAKMGKHAGLMTVSDDQFIRDGTTVELRTISFAVFRGTKIYSIICRSLPETFESQMPAFTVVFQNLAFK